MLKGKKIGMIALAIAAAATFAGCGTANPDPSNNTGNTTAKAPSNTVIQKGPNGQQTMIEGGTPYAGKAKLQQYEKTAKASPKNANAQMQAGISAFVNGDYTTAISYYKKVIAIDPKNGTAYNNIGNVYLRRLNQPKTAVTYYKKATEVQPTYGYGWLNLALCEKQLGDTAAAKAAVSQGLKVVPKTDPVYKDLPNVLSGK